MALAYSSIIPALLSLNRIGGNVVLSLDNPAFILQAASGPSSIFSDIPSTSSPHQSSASDPQGYFRLRLSVQVSQTAMAQR
jgi:hypothetical protein